MHGIVGGASVRWNPYSYVGGNPINRVDPDGRCFFAVVDTVACGIIAAAVIWTGGYALQSAVNMTQPENSGLRMGFHVAGELLGWNSVRYSVGVINDPNASFGHKTREFVSGTFHTALGINFMQAIGNATIHAGKIGWTSIKSGSSGVRNLVSQKGLQGLVDAGRVRVTNLLPKNMNGFRIPNSTTLAINGRLNAFGRLNTLYHEATHLMQAGEAGRIGNFFLKSSLWATENVTKYSRGWWARKAGYFTFAYAWNPAELQAVARGGNILSALQNNGLIPHGLSLGRYIFEKGNEWYWGNVVPSIRRLSND